MLQIDRRRLPPPTSRAILAPSPSLSLSPLLLPLSDPGNPRLLSELPRRGIPSIVSRSIVLPVRALDSRIRGPVDGSRCVGAPMAVSSMTTDPASPPPSAQVVGNAFVQQYYHILHHSPELVFRFYQEGSKLGRPDDAGNMSHVTTTQAINEKIMSMDYGECVAEVKTVDAQDSLGGGVIVLVTGCLTWKGSDKRDFTQSFFLAIQDKGYFVLNDVLRYAADEAAPAHEENDGLADGVAAPPCAPEQEPPQEEHEVEVVEQAVTAEEDCGGNEEEVCNPSDQEGLVVVKEDEPVEVVINDVPSSSSVAVVDLISSAVPEEVAPEESPKKSYASIASSINIGGRQAYVEEKRPSGSRAGSRGRFPPGRGGGNGVGSGFRSDGMRGCGSYGGGRGGYGRGEFNNSPDFSGRGGGVRGGPFSRGGSNEVSYQRVDQMGPGGELESRNGPLASPRSGPPRVQASA